MEESAQVGKKVRTASAWLSTNSTLQADGLGVRKEAYEKPKRLSTLKTPTIKGHVLDCHGLYAMC